MKILDICHNLEYNKDIKIYENNKEFIAVVVIAKQILPLCKISMGHIFYKYFYQCTILNFDTNFRVRGGQNGWY